MPKPKVVELLHEVPRPQIQYVEKLVEVPEIQYVEKIVEVPVEKAPKGEAATMGRRNRSRSPMYEE